VASVSAASTVSLTRVEVTRALRAAMPAARDSRRSRLVHNFRPGPDQPVRLNGFRIFLAELEGADLGQRGRTAAALARLGRRGGDGKGAMVPVPTVLFQDVTALVPREDRVPERPVFQGFGGERFRTAITRACTAAGVPHFSPHDLRHRRVSLLHLGGMPWARIGELVGHDDLVTTARTYTHVVTDERELDYAELIQ
jgi:hypothetical protein